MPESGATLGLAGQRDAITGLPPSPGMGEQGQKTPFPVAQLFTWSGLTSLVLLHLALNLIGPRAVDVLSELSYAPMTPDHFPSLFCKVGPGKVLVFNE